jgi:hypothetical protein
MCIRVARVACDSPLQGLDRISDTTGLETGEAEVVLDGSVERLQPRCIAQRRDCIGWPAGPE